MWSALFVCAIALNLCVCSVGQTLSSGTPLYVQSIGGTHLFSGLLVAVYIVSAMFGRIVSGRIADVRSRRFVMLAGSGALVFGSFLPVLLPFEGMLFVSRIIQGFGFASAQTAIGAFAADALPLKRMGEGIGYFGLGQAIAMALGPAFAVWLVSMEYSEALSVGLGCLGIAMLVISLFIRYEKNPSQLPKEASYRLVQERKQKAKAEAKAKAASASLEGQEGGASRGGASRVETMALRVDPTDASRNHVVEPVQDGGLAKPDKPRFFDRFFERSARYGAIPALLFSATAAVFVSYTTAFAQDMGYANPSLFFATAAVVAIALRLIISKAMDTFNPVRLFAVAIGAGCVSLVLMMAVHQEVVYYLCGIGYGICIGISIPLLNSISVKASPQERYGAANGLFYIAYDIGYGAGVVGWGLIIDLLGYSAIFIGGIACLAAALLLAARLFPQVR